MQNNRYASHAATGSTALDAGLRSYMLGVYNHMTTALALTGFTAFGTVSYTHLTLPTKA